MKVARHEKIIELIRQYEIDTQEELAARLNEAGFKVTQATVSRDIRALKMTKVAGSNGKSRYAILEEHTPDVLSDKYSRVLKDAVISMNIGQNIVVIKTIPGMAMAAAAAGRTCGMTAVLGLDEAPLQACCDTAADEGIVQICNYNCPGQLVIGGDKAAVDKAAALALAAGARRCLPLNVSGPFHSAMLLPAGEKLAAELEQVEIHKIAVPYITNVTADYVTDSSQVKELLKKQISSSVRWQQSVERMIADGVEAFIEIGPKKSLCGFMKRIDKTVPAYHVDKVTDLESVLEVI